MAGFSCVDLIPTAHAAWALYIGRAVSHPLSRLELVDCGLVVIGYPDHLRLLISYPRATRRVLDWRFGDSSGAGEARKR